MSKNTDPVSKRGRSALRQLTATAYHEAGHAVAAYWLGMRIGQVSILPDPDEGTLGRCATRLPKWFDPEIESDPRTREWIRKEVLVLLAGKQAERLFTKRDNHIGARNDVVHADQLAGYLRTGLHHMSDDGVRAYLSWLTIEARALVNNPWNRDAIEAVARELLAKTNLRPSQVKEIIIRSGNERMAAVSPDAVKLTENWRSRQEAPEKQTVGTDQ